MSLVNDVRRRNVAATHELLADGWTSRQLSRAVARGELIRIRQGWYALPRLAPEYQVAVRVGGRLTCTLAARNLGLSTKSTGHVHVAVTAHSSRLRDPRDSRSRLAKQLLVVHWSDTDSASRVICAPLEVLAHMALCQPVELTIAAVDSALRCGLVTSSEWRGRIARMPRRLRRLLARIDERAESITESIVRVRLLGLGIDARLQVRIRGVGRVDFLIGDRLVVEVDGRAYHSDPEAFERDRRRDAQLSIRGFRTLRFSYDQVMNRWGEVKGSVLAALARGDHLA